MVLVIDSGATNYMTHSSQNFSSYSPCPSNKKIAQGEVHLNKSIVLKNVLHVSNLSTNLVSIH